MGVVGKIGELQQVRLRPLVSSGENRCWSDLTATTDAAAAGRKDYDETEETETIELGWVGGCDCDYWSGWSNS